MSTLLLRDAPTYCQSHRFPSQKTFETTVALRGVLTYAYYVNSGFHNPLFGSPFPSFSWTIFYIRLEETSDASDPLSHHVPLRSSLLQ
jgi:hypothetical protein